MPSKPTSLSAGQLESLSQILGETSGGLTGQEIERLLAQAKIADVDPGITKWKRLFNALCGAQNRDRNADRVFGFIRWSMDPARYVGKQPLFEDRRTRINAVLLLSGYEYRTDGRFGKVDSASTLSEAESRANRLRAALSARGVHGDVLNACRAELLHQNVFHAVLEASKSIAEKLRQKSSLQSDGAELVDEALGGSAPRLRINGFVTDTEKSEQRGFTNLLKGLLGVFRNPPAHSPRLVWPMSEEDALDLFTFASYAHRRIDGAKEAEGEVARTDAG